MNYQKLFDYIKDTFNYVAQDEEMQEIENIVKADKIMITETTPVFTPDDKGKTYSEEEVINIHIEIIKSGLIEEGDKKWDKKYEPKVRAIATKYIQSLPQEQEPSEKCTCSGSTVNITPIDCCPVHYKNQEASEEENVPDLRSGPFKIEIKRT